MLITISALTCFPQSVSTDIFWRPWSFNTFTATEMPWQPLLGNICWMQKMCEAGADRECFVRVTGMVPLLRWKGGGVFLGHVCKRISSGAHHISPNRPICHMDLPVQNLAWCLHKRRGADEGLSRNWAASSPHMFAQLAKWQERGLALSTEKQLGWGASYVTTGDADIQVPGSFPRNIRSERPLCLGRRAFIQYVLWLPNYGLTCCDLRICCFFLSGKGLSFNSERMA